MSSPRFSVVMPCYNGSRYLRSALESALAQTYPPEEVLVIDDGSTDDSREIARSYGDKVTCLQQAHEGPSAARNLGADRARGDFVAFLDADDIWMPEKLRLQAHLLETSPNIDLVYTSLFLLEPDGSTERVIALPPRETVESLRFHCRILPSTVVARTGILRSVRWDTGFGSSEDWDLFYRLAKQSTFGVVDEPTTYYRQHPESLSTRNWRKVLENARKVSRIIQRDERGLSGLRRQRVVEARLLANAAIAARQAGSSDYLANLLGSLVQWPMAFGPQRIRMLASMVVQRARELARSPGDGASGPADR